MNSVSKAVVELSEAQKKAIATLVKAELVSAVKEADGSVHIRLETEYGFTAVDLEVLKKNGLEFEWCGTGIGKAILIAMKVVEN